MAEARILRMVEGCALTYRRTWRGSVFTTVLTPVLFLGAMGLGLGTLVDHGAGRARLGGVGYLDFIAPGLLAAAAMQTAATEGTYPIMGGMKWFKTYHAMLATPLTAADIALGQLTWLAARITLTSVVFVLAIVAFGAAHSAGIALALPAAVLTGMAFATPVAAYTASLRSEYGLANLMRFAILPLFLFSGTFFPVSQLPSGLRPVAYVTPLWHGVELCRSLSLGTATLAGSSAHAAYLLVWVVAGAFLAVARFRRRLVA